MCISIYLSIYLSEYNNRGVNIAYDALRKEVVTTGVREGAIILLLGENISTHAPGVCAKKYWNIGGINQIYHLKQQERAEFFKRLMLLIIVISYSLNAYCLQSIYSLYKLNY